MENKEIKNQLHELTLIMKARAKKATPPKHGFGTHEEIIPVRTKTGKIAMQKRKVGITKKKTPASKKKEPKPKKKNQTPKNRPPLKIPEGWKDQGDPKIAAENYEARKLQASSTRIASNEHLARNVKPKKHPVWLEGELGNILASVRGGVDEVSNPVRRVDAMVRFAFPLLKKNKIPYTLMLESMMGKGLENITKNDLDLANLKDQRSLIKEGKNPYSYRDHALNTVIFLKRLSIFVDKKHLPKTMALFDKKQIPQPTEPKNPQVPSKDINGIPIPTPFDLGKVILGSVVSDENKAKFKQRYNPMNFNFNLDKKRKVEVKGFKDQNFTAPHNYTFDSLSINGKNLTKDYLLKKGVSDNFKDFNKLMEGIAKHRDSLLNFDLTKAIQDGLDDMQKVDGYKKGTKTENTERRKKFANALGLPLKPAPFKNWIKDKKIGNINGSKTDYFGFNDSIFNPIGEAKEQKIGWNNLVLDKNLKKADHIFLAPIDPFTKEIGVKGHTPYADVFVANSTTELYKLGIQNGVSNMGYGVFIIDTKNKTIEKMDIHALNKTTLEEAKKESEQIVKDNPFSIKPSKEQKPKMEETKPVINKESDAKNIAEKSKGMTVNGKPVTERDSKDFLEKYSKPLSGQFDAVGTRPFTSIKDKKDFHLDNEGKVNLLDKLLGDGLNESSFAENSKEDYYIKHLFENKFLESEKVGNNPETGYAKWKIKVRPQHKEGIKLFKDIISGK
jgi:hypothetical protein